MINGGQRITKMRTAASLPWRPAPSPPVPTLRCSPFGTGTQAARMSVIRYVRDPRKSLSGAARPTRQKPSPKDTAVSRWTPKTLSAAVAMLVVTATSPQTPVLQNAWLKHINAVGAPIATWRKLDDDVMSRFTVIARIPGRLVESNRAM